MPLRVLSDGTDTMGNYVAGTGAGENLETDSSGDRAANNTFVGAYAGQADTTGSANTGIGYGALRGLTTGYGNIGIGVNAGNSLTTDTHKLYIHNFWYPSYGIFGDFSTGYFGVNTTSPTSAWTVSGTVTAVSVSYSDTLFVDNFRIYKDDAGALVFEER